MTLHAVAVNHEFKKRKITKKDICNILDSTALKKRKKKKSQINFFIEKLNYDTCTHFVLLCNFRRNVLDQVHTSKWQLICVKHASSVFVIMVAFVFSRQILCYYCKPNHLQSVKTSLKTTVLHSMQTDTLLMVCTKFILKIYICIADNCSYTVKGHVC